MVERVVKLLLDTNFLMIPGQFGVDIISEFDRLFGRYEIIVPSFVLEELDRIEKSLRGRDRIAVRIAREIVGRSKIVEFDLGDRDVDEALLELARRIKGIICTNDKELRKKARRENIPVVLLRQEKYLYLDGDIETYLALG